MQTIYLERRIAIAGLDKDINQYFAVITDIRSVGVSKAEEPMIIP